ncbi:MAG: hypothetical protein SFV15_24015 [Polyangiaceae bacterium]|nr:hypothetical protein [Polyangiaceae bacterium]
MSKREDAFSHATTDLMSGVAVTFLLIAAIFMVQAIAARTKERKVEAQNKEELDRIKRQDQGAVEFLDRLSKVFKKDSIVKPPADKSDRNSDPYSLTLTLNEDRFPLFKSGQCELDEQLSPSTEDSLRELVETLCRAAGARQYLLSISLEGHTDDRPFLADNARCGAQKPPGCSNNLLDGCKDAKLANNMGPIPGCENELLSKCESVGFENNVRLSGARAQNLFFGLRQAVASDRALAACLNDKFTVSGRGPVEAKGTNHETRTADRRVVFKVRVRAGLEYRENAP